MPRSSPVSVARENVAMADFNEIKVTGKDAREIAQIMEESPRSEAMVGKKHPSDPSAARRRGP
jgi:hypothetical protein